MKHSSGNESPLTFPCRFPIKVMGKNQPGFVQRIAAMVRRHAPDLNDTMIKVRHSNGDRYLALTFTVHATSREQLDAIYRDLTACDDVVMAL